MSQHIRFETPGRPEFSIAKAEAKLRADHTSSLIVTALTLACSAMSIIDLLLLATSH
jgi:hypothetical protein